MIHMRNKVYDKNNKRQDLRESRKRNCVELYLALILQPDINVALP